MDSSDVRLVTFAPKILKCMLCILSKLLSPSLDMGWNHEWHLIAPTGVNVSLRQRLRKSNHARMMGEWRWCSAILPVQSIGGHLD